VGACAHRNLQELTITKNPLNVHLNHSKRQNRPALNRCTLGRDLRVLLPHPIAQRRCGAREKGSHRFLQQEGVDFNDTFSPVVRLTIIQVILSLVVSQQWPIRQLDVHNVFLHGDLKEQVFMSQPSGFIDQTKPNHVCLLSKSIYGLKQSPRS
jgi:Reverse transcriptase (RNA-dependent DNA polymerase)